MDLIDKLEAFKLQVITTHPRIAGLLNETIEELRRHQKQPEGFQREVLQKLDSLIRTGEKIMATQAQMQATVDDLNTATNTVAAELAAMQSQIVPGTMTAAQSDAINASLGGIVTRLQSMGTAATPTGNVPPTAPTSPATA